MNRSLLASLLDPEGIKRALRRKSLLAFTKASFILYRDAWFHREICRELEQFSRDVAAGLSPRLMLFIPPRHGKSFLVSERFPVWHLGRHPEHLVACASHNKDLANKFSRKARELAATVMVRDTFPELELARKATEEWETKAGGAYKAVGVGSGFTGSGAHILIIDDPVRDAKQAGSKTYRDGVWDWYGSTAYTRLMPGGGILVVHTRWHEDDLAGRLLEAAKSDPEAEQWKVICYPAIAEKDEEHRKEGEALDPARYPLERLKKIAKAIGSRFWAALYQQRPSPTDGSVWQRKWWRYYRQRPSSFDQVLMSWDCTFKDTQSSDYVVGQVWGRKGADKYLLDQVRAKMDFPGTVKAIKALAAKWPQAKAKLVEDKANGSAVIATLKSQVPGLIAVNPEGSKEARAAAVSADIEAGNVYLPDPGYTEDGSNRAWVHDFVEEAAAFPNGPNDDQVDAASQALHRLGLPVQGEIRVYEGF
jgi:predicted phage terminase large subunit-like protein